LANIPSREALNKSTSPLSNEYLPRDYRVTGTQPPQQPTARPKKASAGPTLDTILVWTATGLMLTEIAILIYLSYRGVKGVL
jgi:hypothetical protein